jgi:hypothetical protein
VTLPSTVPNGAAPAEPIPVMFTYCRQVYDTMLAQAYKAGGRKGPDGEEPVQIVYEGKLTELFKRLHLSVPYYTYVRQHLIRMGCIRQLRRGGGTSMSQWEMIREPTEELWREAEGYKQPPKDKTSMLEQQIRGLSERFNQLAEGHNMLCDQVETLTKLVRKGR